MNITRRNFLKIASSLALSATILIPKNSSSSHGYYGTLIDLTRCDGCTDEPVPKCVQACRDHNRKKFPEPVANIQPYWPHTFYEDWSKKRDIINTLTPYNWIFVQKVSVNGTQLFIPRRCMHCINPPCVSLCPFGALSKETYGNTVISDKLCFGGAKCRDVCPWHIPQRQAGVGLYLKMMPKFAGGGVMYKCDLCAERIAEGKTPVCILACEQRLKTKTAMFFGEYTNIASMASSRAVNEHLYLYGETQNGGTSTFYLSPLPFDAINRALVLQKERFQMASHVPNPLEKPHRLAQYFLLGGFGAAFAGIVSALCPSKKKITTYEHKKT